MNFLLDVVLFFKSRSDKYIMIGERINVLKKKALKGTKRQWSVYIQCVLNSIIELNFQCRIGSEIVRILSLVAFDMCFVIDICFVQIV